MKPIDEGAKNQAWVVLAFTIYAVNKITNFANYKFKLFIYCTRKVYTLPWEKTLF